MNVVIAAIDNSGAAGPVVATAVRLAELYRATARALHVREEDRAVVAEAAARRAGIELESSGGQPIEALKAAARQPAVRMVVLGARGTPAGHRPVGSTALELITSVATPLTVVPPDAVHPGRIDSILVPLDGTAVSAAALASTIDLARGSGIEVIVLHVGEEERLPSFSEHAEHEARTWAEEFVTRHCRCRPEEVTLELRVGVPREQVIDVARGSGADLIAMGWRQDLAPGHAAVVREVLARCQAPTLLVPVNPRPGHESVPGPQETRTE